MLEQTEHEFNLKHDVHLNELMLKSPLFPFCNIYWTASVVFNKQSNKTI